MICFKDMSFCASSEHQCKNTECPRYFGPDQREAAAKWWGSDDAPICFGEFWDRCTKRIPVED